MDQWVMQDRRRAAGIILAKRLELVPEDIVYQYRPIKHMEFIEGESFALWHYEEYQRDAEGHIHFDGVDPWIESRTARVPLELLREYTNHVKYGVPGE